MKNITAIILIIGFVCGCAQPRMTIITGTSLGLHCTPGNANTTPPQISIAYKRIELAAIPTSRSGASYSGGLTNDAYSSLAGFDFKSSFFGPAQLQEFISTGFAARNLTQNSGFTNNFGK